MLYPLPPFRPLSFASNIAVRTSSRLISLSARRLSPSSFLICPSVYVPLKKKKKERDRRRKKYKKEEGQWLLERNSSFCIRFPSGPKETAFRNDPRCSKVTDRNYANRFVAFMCRLCPELITSRDDRNLWAHVLLFISSALIFRTKLSRY